jgi:hypothetical protein
MQPTSAAGFYAPQARIDDALLPVLGAGIGFGPPIAAISRPGFRPHL